MKRILCFIVILCLLASFSGCTVHVASSESGTVRFHYGNKKIDAQLSEEDLQTVKEILDGKVLIPENLSCGFTEDVSIRLGGRTYCIACDTCSFMYVKETGRYINLSDEENDTLRTLMERYGCHFPCN